MAYFVYVLLSKDRERTYVGQTQDIKERLRKHNLGHVRTTKHWLPWELIHQESFSTRSEAMKKESWLKTEAGRKFIAVLVK